MRVNELRQAAESIPSAALQNTLITLALGCLFPTKSAVCSHSLRSGEVKTPKAIIKPWSNAVDRTHYSRNTKEMLKLLSFLFNEPKKKKNLNKMLANFP